MNEQADLKTRFSLRHGLAMLSLIVFVLAANAQSTQRGQGIKKQLDQLPTADKRRAIVIGVDEYDDPNINRLNGAVNDARALASALVQYAGFREDRVTLLASGEPRERRPTRNTILRRLGNLKGTLPADSLLLIAFAGHGIERGGKSFLLPADAVNSDNPTLLEETSVSVETLKLFIRETGARQIFVILDACRNDPSAGRAINNNSLTEGFSHSFDFNVRNREVEAFITLYATSVGQRSYEYSEKKQGYFTWSLIEGLKGKAATERGEVTLASLLTYLDTSVPELVRGDLGQDQRPRVVSEGYKVNQLVLAFVPEIAAKYEANRRLEANNSRPVILPGPRLPNVKLSYIFNASLLHNKITPPGFKDVDDELPLAPPRILAPVKLPIVQQTARLAVPRGRLPYLLTTPKFPAQSFEIPPPPLTSRRSRPRPSDISGPSIVIANAPDKATVKSKENVHPRPPAEETPAIALPSPVTTSETSPPKTTEIKKPSPVLVTSVAIQFETAGLDNQGRLSNKRTLIGKGFFEELSDGVRLEMIEIPGGKFLMGAPANQKGAYPNEKPQHEVTVPGFMISRFEITQAQWRVVASLPQVEIDLNPNPSRFKGDNLPVEQVSWIEAREFCLRLQAATGKAYSLPTEAEWEYACRAGSATSYSFGDTLTVDVANYDGQSTSELARKGRYRQTTISVASLTLANAFGLFDMHGNVAEWCLDEWHDNYDGAPSDSRMWGSLEDAYRVVRGGSWFDSGAKSVSYHRDRYLKQAKSHSVGFRVSLKLEH